MENTKPEEFHTLIVDDLEFKTMYTKKFAARQNWTKPDPRIIHSIIPGTILEIFVTPGEQVKKGQRYMILESMKMENTFTFLIDGKVKSVNVSKGDRIPKGTLVIELE
jgi:biotin carboxyl carrier protein